MRILRAEVAKLWRTAPLGWFLLTALLFNTLLVVTGPDPDYPGFVAATRAGAQPHDPALDARLRADLAGLTNVFDDFDPEALGRAYQGALGYDSATARLIAAKYAHAVPIVEQRAAAGRALDPYYASDTTGVHDFLFGSLFGTVTLEAFLLAVTAGLHTHGIERGRGPEQVVFTSRTGRPLLKAKLGAVLVTVIAGYLALALPAMTLAAVRYRLAGVWNDSVGSSFHMVRDVVVGTRPFFTWLDLNVGSYLALAALVASCLAAVVGLIAFSVGALVKNSYLGFSILLLGGGILLALPVAGGASLLGFVAMLNPVWLWLKQPAWFTDGGLDVIVPHFESVATGVWLGIGALLALLGYHRFRKVAL